MMEEKWRAYDGGLTELNVDIVSDRAHRWSLSDLLYSLYYRSQYYCHIKLNP